jgi:hypothetical protein
MMGSFSSQHIMHSALFHTYKCSPLVVPYTYCSCSCLRLNLVSYLILYCRGLQQPMLGHGSCQQQLQ